MSSTNAFHLHNNTNIAQLAREFSVPYRRHRARIHGRGSKTTAASLKKTLNLIQERALKTRIDTLHIGNMGIYPPLIEILVVKKSLLVAFNIYPPMVAYENITTPDFRIIPKV
ncbi:hypothetical protein N7537_006190 [Penicillium hordei]|uniref:Uncharacterized protein n=1 Tax=Penicillium hordei TaxID=40994 RepID=A0AAD6H4Z5_9EURO|nr:uncharacterized protein N7537_006190 [Penicillium hordei]KAJ5603234.1 hypothetical protein N7537_006190 [Penicillium hordei]